MPTRLFAERRAHDFFVFSFLFLFFVCLFVCFGAVRWFHVHVRNRQEQTVRTPSHELQTEENRRTGAQQVHVVHHGHTKHSQHESKHT